LEKGLVKVNNFVLLPPMIVQMLLPYSDNLTATLVASILLEGIDKLIEEQKPSKLDPNIILNYAKWIVTWCNLVMYDLVKVVGWQVSEAFDLLRPKWQ
jgi:hypothetical protein